MDSDKAFSDAEIYAWLDTQYISTLRNRDVPHPRLLVLFSGPPSSGKSTIARALETEFRALRLENDVVRTLLVSHYPYLSFEKRAQLTYDYGAHLQQLLVADIRNGLWIIDSSIDRRSREFYTFAREHHFATFLIAMDIPVETHKQWIIAGGDRPFSSAEDYLRRMPQRRDEQAAFLLSHQPDMTVQPGYDMDTLIACVRTKLASL